MFSVLLNIILFGDHQKWREATSVVYTHDSINGFIGIQCDGIFIEAQIISYVCISSHTILSLLHHLFFNLKGFLGAGVGALGIAVTSSLSGSGVPVPNLPVPKVEVSTKSAPPKAASAPQSKIAFTRAPKGKYLTYYNTLIMIQEKLLTC